MTATARTTPTLENLLAGLRAGEVVDATALYVDGRWTPSTSDARIQVFDPATEQVIAEVADGSTDDVDAAVAAAKAALPAWSALSGAERADYLERVGQIVGGRLDEFAELASRDVGGPVEASKLVQLGLPIFNFGFYADLARSYDFGGQEVGNSLVVKEPIGVVGCITPWNFPAHQVALKVAAAFAAGCTVVVKPSEVAPLLVHAIAGVMDEVGLPAGVFNLVSGVGPVVGEALVAHPDVAMVSFTGSTRAGKRIAEVAAGSVKRVALELGGKSANVVLDDADLEEAIAGGFANSVGLNCGQACTALTRVLVPADRLAEAEEIAARIAGTYSIGAWDEEGTVIGPLVSKVQHDKVRGYIQAGIDEGATLVTGGLDTGRDTGWFVQPTVFSDVRNDMTIAREEIFGPVVAILPYGDEAEAVSIANDTVYGLAAAVWSGDRDRALRVARQLQAGQVQVNGGAFDTAAPFGGYKQSGLGREAGAAGIEEFLETKAIQL
ncbi:aldehyde dehydrogenase family protein [Klenkia brasiliensis]|uniref:Betaine-aldehyde dehydrogenase n=1 Tax=Klenkia brasiliensis TaxID=333142 RepID=A0A1G7YQZ3_9ACTN|nr:aldehyde dehydrogenase family protein [Klenkia brasiliensis]SDG98824.1 betaine-aldehyde dehydrogenase [Klenkia brasiliensis]